MMAEQAGLPLDDQVPREVNEELLFQWEGYLLATWHAGRCAICNRRVDLVLDHDHFTGRERGYLCRSCNVVEGVGARGGKWAAYGETHPAKILGLEVYYVGMGWPQGWWEDPSTAYRLTGNPQWRPATVGQEG